MSYSYVKTVFPKFEFSKLYNDSLYTNKINSSPKLNVVGFNDNANVNGIDKIQTRIETYKQIEAYEPVNQTETEPYQQPYQESFQNNLRYFNKPIKNQNIPSYNNVDINNVDINTMKETFETDKIGKDDKSEQSHQEIINHINNCPSCKDLILKQFGVETERQKNEEMLELLSYIIFGIFILILLDATLIKK